jgi:SsrA-binding protein
MSIKNIAINKKANFNYELLEKIEAGIMLKGTEVKSLRDGNCSLAEGYVTDQGYELFLKNVNIPIYKHGNLNNHDPIRTRKLLLHKKEIEKIIKAVKEKGITVIPYRMYFKESIIKVEIAIGKGKKQYDKRETMKERDSKKAIQRELKRDF